MPSLLLLLQTPNPHAPNPKPYYTVLPPSSRLVTVWTWTAT